MGARFRVTVGGLGQLCSLPIEVDEILARNGIDEGDYATVEDLTTGDTWTVYADDVADLDD
jgi:hypothetical protein